MASFKQIRDGFAPVDDPEVTAERMVAWSRCFFGDPLNTGHHWLKTNTIPDIHLGIYKALSEGDKFIVITSPRGFAKTTIDSLIYPLYRIYYDLDPTIVLVGKIEGSGIRILRNIKRELGQNLKLREVYGNFKPDTSRKDETVWSAHEIKTANGIFVRSIGMGGDIRGSLDSMYRPTLIIIDDPQAKKHMREPATLEAHEEYFDSDIVYALDQERGKIRFIGNMLGKQCLLAKIVKDKRFKVVEFSAMLNDDGSVCKNLKQILKGHSVWEEMFKTKELRTEATDMADVGKLHVFMAERMNIITDEFDKNLKGFQIHNLKFERNLDQNILVGDEYPDPIRINTYLAVDPAFASTEDSDERALVVFAKGRILRKTNYGKPFYFNCMWILEYVFNHMQPHLIIDETLRLHRKYYFNSVIIEAIGGAQIFEPLLLEASIQDTFFSRFPFSPIMVKYQPMNKKDRIFSGLQPRAKLGQIFLRDDMKELIDEMENFEMYRSPHLLDAIEMGNRYSHECMEMFSNVNQRVKDYWKREEESHVPNAYNAPTSLEAILG